MAEDTSQIRVGITGSLMVAPLGTTVPTTTAAAWAAGWVNLGLLDEDASPVVTPSREMSDLRAWQRFLPVRTVKKGEGLEITFTLIQKSGTNLKLAFGGGTITSLGGGDFRFTPPASSFIDDRMLGLEVVDGSVIDRFIARKVNVVNTGSIAFKKDAAVSFPLTVRVLEPAAGERWELVSNDPAMAS